MIDLSKFPKIGVRVPILLRRRAKAYALDMEGRADYLGGDLTMEGIFAMAALEFLDLAPAEREAIIARRSGQLREMFSVESPGIDAGPAGAGGMLSGKPAFPPPPGPASGPARRKRKGAG